MLIEGSRRTMTLLTVLLAGVAGSEPCGQDSMAALASLTHMSTVGDRRWSTQTCSFSSPPSIDSLKSVGTCRTSGELWPRRRSVVCDMTLGAVRHRLVAHGWRSPILDDESVEVARHARGEPSLVDGVRDNGRGSIEGTKFGSSGHGFVPLSLGGAADVVGETAACSRETGKVFRKPLSVWAVGTGCELGLCRHQSDALVVPFALWPGVEVALRFDIAQDAVEEAHCPDDEQDRQSDQMEPIFFSASHASASPGGRRTRTAHFLKSGCFEIGS